MSNRPLYVRATGKRSGRSRLVTGRQPNTKPGRRLNDKERREIEVRLRAEGRLQSQDRRII
jgi:hypothetical protein